MKKLRRTAAFFAAFLLGLIAWFAVVLCSRDEGELRLARELPSGRLVARVPAPKPPFLRFFTFGRPTLSGRYHQPNFQRSGVLPRGVVFATPQRESTEIWHVRLDPLDKTWELEVTESRTVHFHIAGKAWRV